MAIDREVDIAVTRILLHITRSGGVGATIEELAEALHLEPERVREIVAALVDDATVTQSGRLRAGKAPVYVALSGPVAGR